MSDKIIRVVTRGSDGSLKTKEFSDFDTLESLHDKVGIDDCSTDLTLRGMPVFRGLVGPIPESKTVVRYESPEVFEVLTKEWTQAKTKRRRRRSSTKTETPAAGTVPAPNMPMPGTISSPISTPTSTF